ncbi:hypothetical protein H105_07155 [Trichophyton soudanense CBS 452.61]|uniref:Uncharacterized protein n=1 Tax=Trichophyton soudanense CBS 452.61 TaxID=1215331 RepID=A0A022XJP3_TRISD|nr:hypothetical protein H105_07155 [Trichophyton soudanense CBS 452.61]EZG03533.1 hypothetical protein H106_06981 [Trichophyton rubrum CBS 735.88]
MKCQYSPGTPAQITFATYLWGYHHHIGAGASRTSTYRTYHHPLLFCPHAGPLQDLPSCDMRQGRGANCPKAEAFLQSLCLEGKKSGKKEEKLFSPQPVVSRNSC